MNESAERPVQNFADGAHHAGTLPSSDLDRIMDVKVEVTVELGRRRLRIADVLGLAPNSVLEFFKRSEDPLDVRVNGRLIARGEAVVIGDRYGIRVTEVVKPQPNQGGEDLLP